MSQSQSLEDERVAGVVTGARSIQYASHAPQRKKRSRMYRLLATRLETQFALRLTYDESSGPGVCSVTTPSNSEKKVTGFTTSRFATPMNCSRAFRRNSNSRSALPGLPEFSFNQYEIGACSD